MKEQPKEMTAREFVKENSVENRNFRRVISEENALQALYLKEAETRKGTLQEAIDLIESENRHFSDLRQSGIRIAISTLKRMLINPENQ